MAEKLDTTTSTKLSTSNPEHLIYQNDIQKLTVLGGIKLEGLDRMRVTLKIELKQSARPPVRHNIDLYNDSQCEKLIRKIAERHEIGTSVVAASLSELTEQLEHYRLQRIKENQPEPYQSPALTPDEQREATNFLQQGKLLERTSEIIGRAGVIGEVDNRLLMFLIFTSRKREHPLHVVSLGSSGTGKTHLQEKVGELIPEEDRIEITTLSENAFYYFGKRELRHKLILIEDLDGADSALYPLRELQSKKRISKTIAHKNTKGETRTIHLVVEGPVSVAGCTTQEQIYEDNANRSFLLYLDESPEQDRQIMHYQRALSAGRVDTQSEQQAAQLLRNCQRILEPVAVRNPWAEQLEIPAEVFKPRRTNNHYLQFIEVITFYHQYQREKKADPATGEIYIETTLEDIAAANQLMKAVLLRKADELSGAARNYLENIKAYLKRESKKKFTNREIRRALRINASNQKRWTLALVSGHYLKRAVLPKGKQESTKARGYQYEVVSYQEFQQLQDRIGNVLDESLEKLKGWSTSSTAVQTKNEPLNPQPVSTIGQQFTLARKTMHREEKNEPFKAGPEHLSADRHDGAEYTLHILLQASKDNPNQSFTPHTIGQLTGKSRRTESRYLKELAEAGWLERHWEQKHYAYRVIKTNPDETPATDQ